MSLSSIVPQQKGKTKDLTNKCENFGVSVEGSEGYKIKRV